MYYQKSLYLSDKSVKPNYLSQTIIISWNVLTSELMIGAATPLAKGIICHHHIPYIRKIDSLKTADKLYSWNGFGMR